VTAFPLFPDQRDVYESVREVYRKGARAVCLVCPTGFGKTRVCAEFVLRALAKGIEGPIVWVTHTTDLVDQARKALIKYGVPSDKIGTIAGGSTLRLDQPIQIAIMAKLLAIVAKGGALPKSRLIVADEAHHFVADTWKPLLKEMREPGGFVLLPTATPERADGRPLGDIADCMVVGPSVRRLTLLGRLVPCLTIDPKGHPSRHLAAEPLDAYLAHAKGRPGFMFGSRVEFLETEAAKFNAEGVAASVIHAKTSKEHRRALLDAFNLQSAAPLQRAGFSDLAPRVLMGVGTLAEGLDAPIASCVILTQLHKHPSQYLQKGGRGLRICPPELIAQTGLAPKENLVLIDLCGNREAHGNLDDEREYSLDGRPIRRSADPSETTEKVCGKCGAVVERWAMKDKRKMCPECGALGREMTAIEVRERELEEAGRIAKPSAKARTFLWYLHEAARAGHRRGRAVRRYVARFGEPPPREVWAVARPAWEAGIP
jgi:DNA repair protein RadD